MLRWLFSVALMLCLGACGGIGTDSPIPTPTFDPFQLDSPIPAELITDADAEHVLLQSVYVRVAPSVVAVEAIAPDGTLTRGSGFIYDRNGRIITSAQVIAAGDTWRVTFDDGLTLPAALLGQDAYSDVAVLSVEAPPARLLPVTFADSDSVQVGERAIVIGNPYGLKSSLISGLISGVGRQLPSSTLIDFGLPAGFQNPRILQTSIPIPAGGNGGVVLNSHGEVIGLSVEVASAIGLYQGIGFAVPSNTVTRVVPDLIRDGHVAYAWLGINTLQSTYGLASFAPTLRLATDSGVLITQITPDSPAAEAGLRGGVRFEEALGLMVCNGGDIITAINNTFINHVDELVYYLLVNHIPGDVVTLLVLRDGEPIEVNVTLAERPETTIALPPCGDAALPEGTPPIVPPITPPDA